MATRRALQLLGARSSASLIGRQTSRSGFFNAARALSAALPSQNASEGRNGSFGKCVEGTSMQQKRWHSRAPEDLKQNKVYQFEDVLHILETPSDSRLLIDVREPHEFDTNSIPTAINLPITSQPDALLLDEQEFHDRFGFAKPPKGKEIVFFCKAGVRGSAAAGIARKAGYTNIGEYRGSWLDWQKRGGPGTKSPPMPEGMGEPKAPITETRPTDRSGEAGEEDLGPQGAVPYPPAPRGIRQ
ncbi:Rhodanese-like protein [Decorospora gaudefroyi]|uniref:Rhodanese-like protein n=1 Tax=Decorospora gaudefroyi TaxID=184978 RepID=A0A6A5KH43_9PLEO|nr:Rhodanese-like protein [Decorospora gaudefroyi]